MSAFGRLKRLIKKPDDAKLKAYYKRYREILGELQELAREERSLKREYDDWQHDKRQEGYRPTSQQRRRAGQVGQRLEEIENDYEDLVREGKKLENKLIQAGVLQK